ncbi:macrolide 2'-phosphotransferase [Streptacidiphilus sp. PAMC 29251]
MNSTVETVQEMLRMARARGLELMSESARLDETGWDFLVLHGVTADGTPWILRRPRRSDAAAAIGNEKRLLEMLYGQLPVAIPEWRFADDELIAYRRLAGEPAASEDVVSFQLNWRIDRTEPPHGFVEPLGHCMAVLHSTPVGMAAAAGVPVRSPDEVRERFGRQLETGRAELGLHPSWLARGQRWLERDNLWSDRTVLIHGDLHPGHTLVDSDGFLVGILDWTDAEVGDPGMEFIEAARKFEPPMLDELLDSYSRHGGPAWSGLRRHVVEGIAFAPLALGVLGLTSDKPRYVEAARRTLGIPTTG